MPSTAMMEDSVFAALSTNDDSSPEKISKSKKKRLRQKRKKTKGGGDDVSVASNDASMMQQQQRPVSNVTSDEYNTILTPQEREALQNEGFSMHDIVQAVESMWDKNLPYDEYDAVLKFLKHGADEEEGGVVHNGENKEDHGDQGTVQTFTSEDGAAEVESTAHSAGDASSADLSAASAPKPKAKLSMAEKLDMVAGAHNVTDSIFALTQWINKVATPHEIEELCVAQKTKAFSTVFKRGIDEANDNTQFETAILPGLVRLVFGPLKKYGIQMEAAEEVALEESVESLLKQARKVVILEEADNGNNDISGQVTDFIVARISEAIQTAKLSSDDSISRAVSTPVTGRKSLDKNKVSAFITKREMQKLFAKKAGIVARSSMEKLLPNGNGFMMNGSSSRADSVSDGVAVPTLVDEVTLAKFDERRMAVEELKSKGRDRESPRLKELRSVVSDLESERLAVQGKIAELKVTLQKLESEDEELAIKLGSVEGDIAEEQMKDSAEAKSLEEQLRKAKEAAKYGNLVGSLSGMMKSYAKTVETATIKKVKADEESKSLEELASSNMGVYLQQLSKYFAAESQCLLQLKSRLQLNTTNVTNLRLEMEQMAGLGLTTTISQIEDSISSSEQMIKSDSQMLVAFMNDAAAMVDDLVNRLAAYHEASKLSGALEPLHKGLLADIKASVDDAGIAGGERLKVYSPPSRAASPIVKTDFTDTAVSSVATPSPQALKFSAGVLPKLTWASSVPSSVPQGKPSLLDIQKEELASKN